MTQPPYKAPLLESPLHSRTEPLCLTKEWVRWGGYASVDTYVNTEHEYFAIRNAATLYDLSPMRKYQVSGPDAARYVNRLVTRNVDKLPPGRVAYAVWCNDHGKVLDDGTIFRFGPDEFRICSQERHLCWFLDCAIGYNVYVEDVTEQIASIALQGPRSFRVLQALDLGGFETLKPFGMVDIDFAGSRMTVSRTGFTGDLGYEFWLPSDKAVSLWDRLMEAGRLYGVRPVGSKALDLTRIEAGFIVPLVDFMPAGEALRPNRGRSPFELALDWLVDFDKSHFIGRRALLAERQGGSRRRVVGLDVAGNKPAGDTLIYAGKSKEVGAVTSAMWSPTCKRNIAIATLERPYDSMKTGLWAEIYVNRERKWEKVIAPCRPVERPFFKAPRRSAIPPLDY
jgi:aminomethyltransferase